MGRSWEETAKIAQDLRNRSIAEVEPAVPDVPSELPKNVIDLPRTLLSEEEVVLTEKDPEELLAALARGEISSSTVTLAFLRRAGLAQKLASTS
jgi:amidase